jgi:hypothetical protein
VNAEKRQNEECYREVFGARGLRARHLDQRSAERNGGNGGNDIAKRQRCGDDRLSKSIGKPRITPTPVTIAALGRIAPRKNRADFCHSHPLPGPQ